MGSISNYKGLPFSTVGHLPEVNSKAPNFLLISSRLEEVSLASFANKSKLIHIVPSLDIPTSVISASRFDREIGESVDVVIFLISADTPFTLNRITIETQLYNLIPLSTSKSPDFARDYGVLIIDGPLAGLTAEAVVVLDGVNNVQYSEITEEVMEEPKYSKIFAALERSRKLTKGYHNKSNATHPTTSL